MSENQIEGGVIVFVFRGGPRDGETARSDVETDDESTCEAVMLWAMTGGGQIGRLATVTSSRTISELIGDQIELGRRSYSSKKHKYRVIDRQESEEEIRIMMEFQSRN